MPSPRPKRGEVWQVDLGMAAKSRPALVLGVPTEVSHQVCTFVPHTTSPLGSDFEINVPVRFLREGVFDAQGIGTTGISKFQRKLGALGSAQIRQVEDALLNWLEID